MEAVLQQVDPTELIVAFMNGEVKDNGLQKDRVVFWCNGYRPCYDGTNVKLLKYDESWDWLMPVYRKIKDVLGELMDERKEAGHPHSACKGDLIDVDISCAVMEIMFQEAYNSIVKFIEWYNSRSNDSNETPSVN